MNRQILSQTTSIPASSSTHGATGQAQSFISDNAGTDALLFKDDPEFWFETVRLFGAAEYGGALFGEVIAIAESIKSGDAEKDLFFQGQAQQLFDHLTCPKTMVKFTGAEGAGVHCEMGASRLAYARMYDWLDETLSAVK
jgi:hypothetical protein